VWDTVNTYYLYPDFHGLDWQEIRTQYAPWVAAAPNNDEFYALLTDMVEQLGDHHSRFLAPTDANRENSLSRNGQRHVGIGVKTVMTHDGVLIEHVIPDSPADQAGLRPQDRIIAVDGVPCTLTPCHDIHGPVDAEVRLTVLSPGEKSRDVLLKRDEQVVEITLPSRRIAEDIGYLQIPSLWVSDMHVQVSGSLTDLVVEKPLRGLILDLRGNPGGWRDVLISVLSHFVRGEVGTFFDRQHMMPLVVREGTGPDLRYVPLVVLIDSETASYAEVMAGILQTEAGAYLIGEPSSGNTETIYAYELAGGARLWLAQEGFRLTNGVNLEGVGIQPDVVIEGSTDNGSDNNTGTEDPYITEALRYFGES
jgi:C-terminal peptidase prc